MQCNACDNQIEPERLELLDTKICSKCAASGLLQPQPLRGATVYDNDGVSEIQIMNNHDFDIFDRTTRNRDGMHGCS